MTITQQADQLLSGVTAALGHDVYNLAQDDVFAREEWPLAQRIEQPDCCALCRNRQNLIIRRDHPDFKKFARQFHINCKGYWAYIHRDEGHEEMGPKDRAVWVPTKADWHDQPIPDGMVEKYGHFVAEPKKYAALNVPARPGGRDFIVTRGEPGQPGTLTFAPALPDALLRQTVARISALTLQSAAVPVVARAATLRQAAYQIARRATIDPSAFVRDFGHDHLEYGAGYARDEFARLPETLLGAPDLAVARARVAAGAGSHPVVLFRGHVDGVETTVALDVRTGQLTHIAAPADLLSRLPDFLPLTGGW